MLDQETTQALEAAVARADAIAGAVNAKPAKKRNINHVARLKKAWGTFQTVAAEANDNGVVCEAYLNSGGEQYKAAPKDLEIVVIANL